MQTEVGKKIRTWAVIRNYAKATWVYPWLLVLAIIGAVGLEASNVIGPLYMRQFINLLAKGTPSHELLVTLFTTLAIFTGYNLLSWAFQRLRMTTISVLESRVMRNLSREAFEYLIGHSFDFFQSNFAGTLTRRVNRYSRSYEQVFDSFILTFLPASLFAVGTIYVLWTQNSALGIGLLIWTVVFFIIQIFMTRWRQSYKLVRSAEDSRVTGILSDAVSNHATITLFASRTAETSYYGEAVQRWMTANLKSWNADNWVYSIQGLFGVLSQVGLLGGGIYLWNKGLITVGDFVLIEVYILGLMNRMWEVGNVMRRLNDAFADASEMVDILNKPHDIADAPHASKLVVDGGTIEFKDVSFNFNQTRSILEHFSLKITSGEKIALVGPSGAGKSTVTKLLLRLYDVSDGVVSIDGQDIAKVTQESLRTSISYVPQEPILFHRTLMENIRYGRPEATDAEVMEAAKKAHAHEFITGFSEGYDTFVGERGVKLSGGERQRVAIARAILKNAPILVLDEATSSLDSESEHLIQEALDVLMEGKTVIVIAHRLSTIMKMDRIVVMEGGKVVASGTHTELLKQDGLYAKLWSIQAGGFIGGSEDEAIEGEAEAVENEEEIE